MTWVSWDNLWKAFQFTPGTAKIRVLLAVWELLLGVLVGVGAIVFTWTGLCIGLVTAFFAHELLFRLWVTKVVGIEDADEGDVVGRDPKAILTLERWIGKVK